MKWNEYENNYIRMAKIEDKSDEYCIRQLEYAKHLFDKNVPIIYNQKHLCMLLGYSEEYVYSASNGQKSFYRTFYIKKSNGKKRKIDEPLPSLKEIQRWILDEILVHVSISPYAKAYIKKRSVKDNARFHRKQKKVLSMDLTDFFSTITYGRVLHVFESIGYRTPVAVILANLCCLDNTLPQGAPTSPMLANIIASPMDYKIWAYVKGKNIRYTRYADDMTFSGDFNEGDLVKGIERIVKRNGFRINHEKTRIRKTNQRQEVTGIVVNEKMQLERKLRRRIRSDAYYISKYGLDSHMQYSNEEHRNYLYHLIGLASYGCFINPLDSKMKVYLEIFKNELSKQ